MPLKSNAMHWGTLAKTFHWAIVALLLVQGTLGLVMVELPKKPSVITYFTLHKSLGLTILLLALLRLGWRLFDRRPEEPASMPRWQVTGARVGHALLYALLFAVPLSGWLFDSATALRPLYWFGLFQVPSLTGGPNPDLKDFTEALHFWLFWTLAAVAAGHATIALIHHFHDRDEVLRRMLPGRSRDAVPAKADS